MLDREISGYFWRMHFEGETVGIRYYQTVVNAALFAEHG